MIKGLIFCCLLLSACFLANDKAAEAKAAREASDSIMRAFESIDKDLKKSNDTLLKAFEQKLDSLNK